MATQKKTKSPKPIAPKTGHLPKVPTKRTSRCKPPEREEPPEVAQLEEAQKNSRYSVSREGIGGRPLTRLTPEQVDKVYVLASVLTLQQIADYFGFSADTFRRMLDRDPRLQRAYRRGLAEAVVSVGTGVILKARSGDARATEFFLKTRGGWVETKGVDHTSSDGSLKAPTAVKIVHVVPSRKGEEDGDSSTAEDREALLLGEGEAKD